MVTCQSPKSPLLIGVASLFQPSKEQIFQQLLDSPTDGNILKSPMTYALSAFGAHSVYVMSPF